MFEAGEPHRRPHAHARDRARGPARRGRHRLHRLQRPHLPELPGAADRARRRAAAERDELLRADGRRASNTTAPRSTACSRSAATSLRPAFWRMIRDILRFNREAPRCSTAPTIRCASATTCTPKATRRSSSSTTSCRWAPPSGAPVPNTLRDFPARYFVRFFHNHGMLTVDDRPQWRTVRGGSARYVEKLTRRFPRPHPPAHAGGVRAPHAPRACSSKPRVARPSASTACSSPATATRRCGCSPMRADAEREVLGAIRYQRNDVVLHTDTQPAAEAPAGLGGVELPRARPRIRARRRHVPHEHPAAPQHAHAAAGHAEHVRSHRSDARVIRAAALRTSGVHARGRGRAGAPGRDQRRRIARTSAARTGASASTKTAS